MGAAEKKIPYLSGSSEQVRRKVYSIAQDAIRKKRKRETDQDKRQREGIYYAGQQQGCVGSH